MCLTHTVVGEPCAEGGWRDRIFNAIFVTIKKVLTWNGEKGSRYHFVLTMVQNRNMKNVWEWSLIIFLENGNNIKLSGTYSPWKLRGLVRNPREAVHSHMHRSAWKREISNWNWLRFLWRKMRSCAESRIQCPRIPLSLPFHIWYFSTD